MKHAVHSPHYSYGKISYNRVTHQLPQVRGRRSEQPVQARVPGPILQRHLVGGAQRKQRIAEPTRDGVVVEQISVAQRLDQRRVELDRNGRISIVVR